MAQVNVWPAFSRVCILHAWICQWRNAALYGIAIVRDNVGGVGAKCLDRVSRHVYLEEDTWTMYHF